MENRMDLPLGENAKMEGYVGDDLLYFEWASSFPLEFPWSVHMDVGSLEPDFISYFPRRELGRYPFFHLLLSHLVGSLGIISSGRQI